ncbi:LysE family translocator [Acinetobacter sp. WZC-1]|uniref:LysE family translocator n=1 Tax=Acinetobacter sp. WZC-1 TaxID=3459034 RepID=UPI00403DE080
MTVYALVSFLIYSFVTSITPGPNNIMLISSGLTFGFKKSIPHILGIGCGFALMVSLVGTGIGSILTSSKLLYEMVKIAGICYLLYLAYQIFKADRVNTTNSTQKPMTLVQAALFQWVNPKAWIMAMGAVTTYTSSTSDITVFIMIGVIYGLVSIPCVGVWAYAGDKLQKFIHDPGKVRKFNISMSILLVLSIVSPLMETFQFFMS